MHELHPCNQVLLDSAVFDGPDEGLRVCCAGVAPPIGRACTTTARASVPRSAGFATERGALPSGH